MAIKDQTMTTDTDSEGSEFVSEINAVVTETRSDGTEVTAEITTTADADNPTEIEGHMTITETAPDGTETVTEITTAADGTMTIDEDESALEEIVEAAFGVEIGDDATPVSPGTDVSGEEATDVYLAESDFQEDADEFTVGDETFDLLLTPTDTTEISVTDAPLDAPFGTTDAAYTAAPAYDSTFATTETTETVYNAASETDAAELAEQEAHTQAATDAQESADEFIATGDYAAAAEARETAENESWEAGDGSMLGAYDAQDLTNAAEKQEDAAYYEQQQATLAQQGDYEGARTAADNAAYATYDADTTAGGDDHTGQADAEKYNMDNAVWQEGIADTDRENAAYHAEAGNLDAAESSLDSADAHQAIADNYGDLGEHGGDMAVYDASSEVATGGTYESTYDSDYDSTAVDTGFDATPIDMTAASTYDSGTDDV